MKKLLILTFMFCAAAQLFTGCEEAEEGITPEITIETDNAIFTSAEETKTITVTSNVAWTATVSADQTWCSVTSTQSTEGGTLSIKVTANNAAAGRQTSITVKDEKAVVTYTITVKQFGQAPAIVVSPKNKTVEAGSGTFEVEIITNVECNVTTNAAEWITLGATAIPVGTNKVAISIAVPNTGAERSGQVVFMQKGGSVSDTLHVAQKSGIVYSRQTDSLALLAFYDAAGKEAWTNWKTAAPLEQWAGLSIENGRVVRLSFENIAGTLPPELGHLNMLKYLYINRSPNLQGSIPPELGNLVNLEGLELSNSNLNGAIPSTLGNLNKLESLYLNNNQLDGAIPSELGKLVNLRLLYLNNNKLSSVIPSELGNLQKLVSLYLEQNALSGTIPHSLGSNHLLYLNVSRNKLGGAIPQEVLNVRGAMFCPQNGTSFANYDCSPSSPFSSLLGESTWTARRLSGGNHSQSVWIEADPNIQNVLWIKGLTLSTPLKMTVLEEGSEYVVTIDLPQDGGKYYYFLGNEYYDSKYLAVYYEEGAATPTINLPTAKTLTGRTDKTTIQIQFDNGIAGSIYDKSGNWTGYFPNISAWPGTLVIEKSVSSTSTSLD